VARRLVGKTLVRVDEDEVMSGRIVELEAYRGAKDPASHAFGGMTKRNSVMFGEPGHAYCYFAYGNHWMFNMTTEKFGIPGAVLIRAIEPREGVELMKRNRGVGEIDELASGPGKLTKALRIDGSLNGEDLITSKRLFVLEGHSDEPVKTSARIGVTVGLEYKWRYFIDGNRFISRAKTSARKCKNA